MNDHKDLIAVARTWAANKVKLDGGLSDEVVIIRNLCNALELAQPLITANKLAGVDIIVKGSSH